ncbi:MAG TPA: DNA recombination protein RmuC, partial [Bacteroidales bacterium]|nr:DNA recombination protein RmuC [Bacteroidales bacterium]
LRNEVQSQFRTFSEIISRNITENGDQLKLSFKTLEETLRNNLKDINESMRQKLDNNNVTISELSKSISTNLDKIRDTLQTQLRLLQEDNSKKLEEMRNTVDEKLQSTLEKRLSESFKQVSERLELVHKGLGEMQMLANGVGDLKKVLSNVKTRGILGEVQLENILEQILTKDQYVKNVVTRPDCRENVEFAIKLPGKDEGGKEILLPLDAKFPLESYYSLLEAYDSADNSCIQSSIKALEITIKKVAKDIRDKYIEPPHTTDFGIMFLPVEGLYAEVVRRTDLLEILQRDYKIIITGPTTLAAILHSLQMGFRTLAIEKRSSEVWKVLSAVKTEFGKFNDVLKKAQEKINRASEDIDNLVGTRSRQIQNKLKNITTLPVEESSLLLSDKTENNDDSEEENS